MSIISLLDVNMTRSIVDIALLDMGGQNPATKTNHPSSKLSPFPEYVKLFILPQKNSY